MGASSTSMTRLWRGGRGVGTKVGASTEMGFEERVVLNVCDAPWGDDQDALKLKIKTEKPRIR
jgi:hypothetical protein